MIRGYSACTVRREQGCRRSRHVSSRDHVCAAPIELCAAGMPSVPPEQIPSSTG